MTFAYVYNEIQKWR